MEAAGLREGLLLAISFNPLSSVLGAVCAAAAAGSRKWPRTGLAVLLAAVAWIIGDGARVFSATLTWTREGLTVAGSELTEGRVSVLLAIWAVGSLVVGYALPAIVGAYVGRNVHRGTGRLSAAVTAGAISGALTAAAATLTA